MSKVIQEYALSKRNSNMIRKDTIIEMICNVSLNNYELEFKQNGETSEYKNVCIKYDVKRKAFVDFYAVGTSIRLLQSHQLKNKLIVVIILNNKNDCNIMMIWIQTDETDHV